MEKERVQELLDDFVVKNEQDINNVAVENPPLYDAFISALSLLSSKFGTSQEIKKLTEEEIEAKKPKKELPFKVGDVFMRGNLPQSMKREEKDILYTILSIDESKSEVNYQINFVKKGTSKLKIEKIETILEDIEVGNWVLIDKNENTSLASSSVQESTSNLSFKEGDKFTYKNDRKPIYIISKIKNDIVYLEWYDEKNQLHNVSYEIELAIRNFTDKTWNIISTSTQATKTKAKSTRVSPSQHASQTAVGTIMTGNDGNQWIVVEDSRGVRKWQRNIVKSTTKVISDEEQELLDAIEGAKLLANTGDSDAKKELSLLKAQLKKLKAK